MQWYKWFALCAFLVCLASCAYHFFKLIRAGRPKDFAKQAGSIPAGLRYSFTSAMSPVKKESAFLHLPSYLAGIIYHISTFIAVALFLLLIFIAEINTSLILGSAISLVLLAGAAGGVVILVKRVRTKRLRTLSNPDDYISNILVTLFQIVAALVVMLPETAVLFYVVSAFLWLYFPLGKLKHALYFFAARYHLGLFFGSRGVWPLKKQI